MDMDFIEVNKYIDELRSAGNTWQEIADLCNIKYNKNYGESKWRKPYQAWRVTVDDVLQDESNDLIEQEMKRLARAQMRLDANRKILNAKKQVVNDEINKVVLHELFNEEIVNTLKDLSPKLKPIKLERTEGRRNYVIVKGDGHYNGNQDLDTEFSEYYSIIKEKVSEYNIKELIMAELGDTIDGATLRPSQLLSIKSGIVEQAIVISRYYIELLNMLTEELNINIKFVIVESSNHTQLRTFGTGRSELPFEDLMWVIAEQIKLGTTNNKRIEVISAPRIITKINGFTYLFEHGHDINSKGNHIQRIESFYNVKIDYAYGAHFHRYKSEDLVLIEEDIRDKNMTFIPHSNVLDDDYANGLLLSSAPAVHFCIDTETGKKGVENIVLRKSYMKAREDAKKDQIKVKIKDI